MAAVDSEARRAGLRLVLLDTLVGSDAESIYRHLGWQAFSQVLDYALAPDGTACAMACFYKQLG